MTCSQNIADKKAELIAEQEQVVKEHNEALELKNAKFARYREIKASLKTLVDLESAEETTETEVVTE